MKVCSLGHAGIAFEGWNCPCCEAIHKAEQLEDQMKELQSEVEHLKTVIEECGDE